MYRDGKEEGEAESIIDYVMCVWFFYESTQIIEDIEFSIFDYEFYMQFVCETNYSVSCENPKLNGVTVYKERTTKTSFGCSNQAIRKHRGC